MEHTSNETQLQERVQTLEIEKIAPAFRHIDDVSTPELRKQLP